MRRSSPPPRSFVLAALWALHLDLAAAGVTWPATRSSEHPQTIRRHPLTADPCTDKGEDHHGRRAHVPSRIAARPDSAAGRGRGGAARHYRQGWRGARRCRPAAACCIAVPVAAVRPRRRRRQAVYTQFLSDRRGLGHGPGSATRDAGDVAGGYAATIVRAVQQEDPNDLHHPMTGPHDRPRPRAIHPAFSGCYDGIPVSRALGPGPAAAPGPGYASGPRRAHGVHDHPTADALATEAASVVGHPGFERPTAGDGRCCWPTNCPPGTTRMLGARRTSARWPTPSPSCCWPGWLGPPTPAATGRTPTAPSAWSARFPGQGTNPPRRPFAGWGDRVRPDRRPDRPPARPEPVSGIRLPSS
jgi:hypothetical protein